MQLRVMLRCASRVVIHVMQIITKILFFVVFFFLKQKTEYEFRLGLVGAEMCIRASRRAAADSESAGRTRNARAPGPA